MSDLSNEEEQARRQRGVVWTAVILGLVAFGFYIAFIVVTGSSN